MNVLKTNKNQHVQQYINTATSFTRSKKQIGLKKNYINLEREKF